MESHIENIAVPSYPKEFEEWWVTTKVHQKATNGDILGVLELALKDMAMQGWEAREKSEVAKIKTKRW